MSWSWRCVYLHTYLHIICFLYITVRTFMESSSKTVQLYSVLNPFIQSYTFIRRFLPKNVQIKPYQSIFWVFRLRFEPLIWARWMFTGSASAAAHPNASSSRKSDGTAYIEYKHGNGTVGKRSRWLLLKRFCVWWIYNRNLIAKQILNFSHTFHVSSLDQNRAAIRLLPCSIQITWRCCLKT